MFLLNSAELKRVAKFLEKYDRQSTISTIAGLLTAPALQPNTLRIEVLAHLAVARCQGRRKPGLTEIGHWLNQQVGNTRIASLEDPVEDVFVTNVETPEGNRRIFQGIWEANDYFLQVVLDTLSGPDVPQKCRDLLTPAFALLRLSNCVAERVGLRRWYSEPSIPNRTMRLGRATRIIERARAVTFKDCALEALDISRQQLAPFFLRDKDKQALPEESIGHSSLELRPLVDFGCELVLALPNAVSPAIRRFVLSELRRIGYLPWFEGALGNLQARQVERDALGELEGHTDTLNPPAPEGKVPSLHAWLCKYDVDKYLHIVLLYDRMEWLDAQGLSTFMKYPEKLRAGLEEFLSEVSKYCRSLPDFAGGMTLLVMGGLGRGFALGFNDWPDHWRLSVIRISDLLMLGSEIDRPITRYLKFIKQKEWAAGEGVYFPNINGDYNFYCFWRRHNYRLVPRELPISDGSMLCISNDEVLPVRKEARILVDRHVIQTVDRLYLPVIRFGVDSYFKSMHARPIYGSLGHLWLGALAGAVETPRGPSWLLIEPREAGEQIRELLYEMWSGFIRLYDKLVLEVEALFPRAPAGPIEIRLNFGEVVVSDDFVESRSGLESGPEVVVNLDLRTVEIRIPKDFLMHFREPTNTGEKLVLYGVAKGLVSLHQGAKRDVDESILEDLMRSVIGAPGIRILHFFPTYRPIEYLLVRQDQKAIFLADEDRVFCKLRLSEACTAAQPDTSLATKPACNKFLRRVVDKVWNQLRGMLQQLNRASVIREVLGVQEAAIQDRDHWRRTAQAVLAIYAQEDDVFAVAQERESDRNNVSLSARTILEMAICECPKVGGREISHWGLDELLAKAALLVEVATDSDAIYNDLIEPRIDLHPNGEYSIDRGFHSTVVKPFVNAYFRENFEEGARKYHTFYRPEQPSDPIRADQVFSASFIRAFRAEFGLTPDEAFVGFVELMELAVERDRKVVETTLGHLKSRLTTSSGLSPQATEAFIRTFSIFHRTAWNEPPPSFTNRDLYPWRFSRRLSATVRPILVFGETDDDKVYFGAGALSVGFEYLLERSEKGHLPQNFFTSVQMKQYAGAVNRA